VDGDRFDVGWDGLGVVGRAARSPDGLVVLEGVVRNQRPDHRLRLHIGLPEPTDTALAGAPFEIVERPLVGEGGEGETPSATWPARHVVMASGTAVFHEGVFEYEIAGGREIAITLLRCVGTISRERLASRPWAAGPSTPTPEAQMIGETAFRLAVWPRTDRASLLDTWGRFAVGPRIGAEVGRWRSA
jgi:alpha-mannosidase